MTGLESVLKPSRALSRLLEELDFREEDVSEAARSQASLYLDAVRYRVGQMREHVKLKAELSVLRAAHSLHVRQKISDGGDRVTENAVEARLLKVPAIQALTAKVQEAEQLEEFYKLLLECYKMRRDATRVVADLFKSQEFILGTSGTPVTRELVDAKEKLKKKYPGKPLE